MLKYDLKVKNAKVLVLGITFKEDCPDVRNTKVVDLINSLKEYRVETTVFDPWANPEEVYQEYGIQTTQDKPNDTYDVVVLAVAHEKFMNMDFSSFKHEKTIVYDVKGKLLFGYTARL